MDLELEGGVEAVAGLQAPAAGPRYAIAGIRQAEGGLRWRTAPFDTRVELDLGVGVGPYGAWVGSLMPEHASLTARADKAWLGVGIAPGRWRPEAVDGWDNALTSFADTNALAPVSLLQAELGFGSEQIGVSAIGGLDLGAGLNLLGTPGYQLETAPFVVGVRGEGKGDVFRLGGGWFMVPYNRGQAFEIDTRVQIDEVGLQGGAVLGLFGRASGGTLQVDWRASETLTPVLRVGTDGATIDTDAGIRWDPARWATLKAEVGWRDWRGDYPAGGALAGWISAAIYTPEPRAVGQDRRKKSKKKR